MERLQGEKMMEEKITEEKLEEIEKPIEPVIVKDIIKQTKINIEIKVSRNYNTVTIGISDEPLNSSTEEEFRIEIKKLAAILREEAENQLKLMQLK